MVNNYLYFKIHLSFDLTYFWISNLGAVNVLLGQWVATVRVKWKGLDFRIVEAEICQIPAIGWPPNSMVSRQNFFCNHKSRGLVSQRGLNLLSRMRSRFYLRKASQEYRCRLLFLFRLWTQCLSAALPPLLVTFCSTYRFRKRKPTQTYLYCVFREPQF